MIEIIFGTPDKGCHVDGAFGDDHLRMTLADLLEIVPGDHTELANALLDAENLFTDEIDMAIAILQEHTEEGLVWWMEAGDLILTTESEVEA